MTKQILNLSVRQERRWVGRSGIKNLDFSSQNQPFFIMIFKERLFQFKRKMTVISLCLWELIRYADALYNVLVTDICVVRWKRTFSQFSLNSQDWGWINFTLTITNKMFSLSIPFCFLFSSMCLTHITSVLITGGSSHVVTHFSLCWQTCRRHSFLKLYLKQNVSHFLVMLFGSRVIPPFWSRFKYLHNYQMDFNRISCRHS